MEAFNQEKSRLDYMHPLTFPCVNAFSAIGEVFPANQPTKVFWTILGHERNAFPSPAVSRMPIASGITDEVRIDTGPWSI